MSITWPLMDAHNPKRMNKGRNYVREWRKHRKMTQEKLAELTGYTPSSISQLETGAQGYEEATLVRLGEALGCRPGDLISGPPEEVTFMRELRELDPERRESVLAALNDMLAHLKRIGQK